jgi:hypothetical protein
MLLSIDGQTIQHNFYPVPIEDAGYVPELPSADDTEAEIVVVGQRSLRSTG